MNVILLEKLGRLGNIGDVAEVKAGYARNYLFPSGIAIPATKQNLVDFEHRKADLIAAHNEKVGVTQKRANKIDGLELTIEVNASDEGKLYGSVGTKEIADAVVAAGGDTDKSEVQLPYGVIRDTGVYDIVLDLGYDVQATIKLAVVSQGGQTPVVDAEDDASGEAGGEEA
jgi:large subunit ribosomal protein L9